MKFVLSEGAWLQKLRLWKNRFRQKWQRCSHLADTSLADTTVVITEALVKAETECGEYTFPLPPAFQSYQYIHHVEEMASWLRPQLQAEGITLKRCRFHPAEGQIYLHQLALPVMTDKEQRNWVRWEAADHVPFEPGSFAAVLLPYEERDGKKVLLAAVLKEHLAAWRQLIALLQGDLRKIIFSGPGGVTLATDFSVEESTGKGKAFSVYRALTWLCFLTTALLLLQGFFHWWQTKQALVEAEQRLLPFGVLQGEYQQSRKTEHDLQVLQDILDGIKKQTVSWHVLLRVLGKTIPSDCWLEKVVQKQGSLRVITLLGKASALPRVLSFKERLKETGLFSSVLLLESSGGQGDVGVADLDSGGAWQKTAERDHEVRFVLQLTWRSPSKEVTR